MYSIWTMRIFWKNTGLSKPQALYNIVDSFFVGKYSPEALTALSVICPLQLVVIALAEREWYLTWECGLYFRRFLLFARAHGRIV